MGELNYSYTYNKKEVVNDNAIAFDIETTSAYYKDGMLLPFDYNKDKKFWEDYEKVSICWIWQCAVEYNCYIGRELETFIDFLKELDKVTKHVKKIIYIHNASFEFQFLRNVLCIDSVFARHKRKPMKFECGNYEFRCSYMLTRMSLEKWAKEKNFKHQKLVGNLDYNVLRTPLTKIDKEKELPYCLEDVLIMIEGLHEYKEKYEHYYNIPLTQTGEIRRRVKKALSKNEKWLQNCTRCLPSTLDDYKELLKILWGGYVHASYQLSGKVLIDVGSFDEKSAYPWAMLSEKYPVSPFIKTKFDEKYLSDDTKIWYAKVKFFKLKTTCWNTYISKSKCEYIVKGKYDNGRLIYADELEIWVTNVDFEIINFAYTFDSYEVSIFKYARADYFPDELRLLILEEFEAKTVYKDREGFETLYAKAKEFINAIYGMALTKDITDEIIWAKNDWGKNTLTEKMFYDKIAKKSKYLTNNFITFAQGLFVPAYARRNLWRMILKVDENLAYSDTDSNKVIEWEEMLHFYEEYNRKVEKRQEEIAQDLGVDISKFRPVSINGEVQSIGTFEFEKVYDEFKTLGSKRYAFKEKGKSEIRITIAGISKSASKAINNLEELNDDYEFTTKMLHEIKAEKLIAHYNDKQSKIVWNKGQYDEYTSYYKYGICLQPTSFHIGLGDYLALILKYISEQEVELFDFEQEWGEEVQN